MHVCVHVYRERERERERESTLKAGHKYIYKYICILYTHNICTYVIYTIYVNYMFAIHKIPINVHIYVYMYIKTAY